MVCVQSLDARAILEERRRARGGNGERAPEQKVAADAAAPEPMVFSSTLSSSTDIFICVMSPQTSLFTIAVCHMPGLDSVGLLIYRIYRQLEVSFVLYTLHSYRKAAYTYCAFVLPLLATSLLCY